MRISKKIIVAILSASIILGVVTANYKVCAQSNVNEENSITATDLENMSNEELNIFIHNIAVECNNTHARAAIVNTPVKLAWLAAAEIAKNKGYNCAGTLVQYSVNGKNYSETDSIFAKKINI